MQSGAFPIFQKASVFHFNSLSVETESFRECSPPFVTRLLVVFVGMVFLGCGKPRFAPNELAAASVVQSQEKSLIHSLANDSSRLIEELFGTPDLPRWPEGIANVVNMDEVERSAGPIGRAHDKIERGIYRKHCVQCHGISGDGAGPAALVLAPYPRDFRRGTFKFKSTPIGRKPKTSDLVRIIEHGIPGTSMPAFGALRNRSEFAKDIETLAEYVKFLSIRGEVERRLIRRAAEDGEATELSAEMALSIAKQVANVWAESEETLFPIPTVPRLAGVELDESIARGREIFASEKSSCYKCHGKEGLGDGVSHDYDEWTKDWTIRVGIDPAKNSEWKQMKPYGAMKPVINKSRNLHLGALRGGSTVEDIATRIAMGIDGTPMPAASISDTDPNSLTTSEFADLVRFVASIAGATSDDNRNGESSK